MAQSNAGTKSAQGLICRGKKMQGVTLEQQNPENL